MTGVLYGCKDDPLWSPLNHFTLHVMEHDGCCSRDMQAAVQVCNMQMNLHTRTHWATFAHMVCIYQLCVQCGKCMANVHIITHSNWGM